MEKALVLKRGSAKNSSLSCVFRTLAAKLSSEPAGQHQRNSIEE